MPYQEIAVLAIIAAGLAVFRFTLKWLSGPCTRDRRSPLARGPALQAARRRGQRGAAPASPSGAQAQLCRRGASRHGCSRLEGTIIREGPQLSVEKPFPGLTVLRKNPIEMNRRQSDCVIISQGFV